MVARALDDDTVLVEGGGSTMRRYLCVCRLRGDGRVTFTPTFEDPSCEGRMWYAQLSTEDPAYAIDLEPIRLDCDTEQFSVDFQRPGAVVLVRRDVRGSSGTAVA
jgi:hypothetical protein